MQGDATRLPFRDASFDSAVATFVFCSLADPLAGLEELRRVLRPGGRVLLVEHVRPRGLLWGLAADLATPVVARLVGCHPIRRTEEAVDAAGLQLRQLRRSGVLREIDARTPQTA